MQGVDRYYHAVGLFCWLSITERPSDKTVMSLYCRLQFARNTPDYTKPFLSRALHSVKGKCFIVMVRKNRCIKERSKKNRTKWPAKTERLWGFLAENLFDFQPLWWCNCQSERTAAPQRYDAFLCEVLLTTSSKAVVLLQLYAVITTASWTVMRGLVLQTLGFPFVFMFVWLLLPEAQSSETQACKIVPIDRGSDGDEEHTCIPQSWLPKCRYTHRELECYSLEIKPVQNGNIRTVGVILWYQLFLSTYLFLLFWSICWCTCCTCWCKCINVIRDAPSPISVHWSFFPHIGTRHSGHFFFITLRLGNQVYFSMTALPIYKWWSLHVNTLSTWNKCVTSGSTKPRPLVPLQSCEVCKGQRVNFFVSPCCIVSDRILW